MKKKSILILTALTAVLSGMLTACSSDNEQAEGRVPITLKTAPLTIEETRAAAGTNLNKDYLESGQTVMVRVRNTGSTGDWDSYAYTSTTNGGLTPPTIPPFYPLDGTHVDVVAYCPAAAGMTFSVQSDQTSQESYLASDLLFASVTNLAKTSAAVPLQFEHKMAKVIVSATAGAGVSTIEEITLHKVLPDVPFNSATGEIGTALGTVTTIKVVKDNTTATVSGAAVIPAQVIDGDLLTIKTNLGTATYAVSSKVFSSGKVYNLNITVNRAAVGATTEIIGWTETASASVNKDEDIKTFTLYNTEYPNYYYTFNMIRVDGGSYTTLGGKTVSGTLSTFYIGQFEVTNFLWWTINTGYPANEKTNALTHPVDRVSYNDIMSSNGFIAQLNAKLADQLDGMHFSLPTDAQWEYAARGGTAQERYPYSGGSELTWVAVINSDSKNVYPQACGSKFSNSLGIFDMTGNVWEWCKDYYQAPANIPTNLGHDYAGPSSGSHYVVRGGGYTNTTAGGPNFENTANVDYFNISTARWGCPISERADAVGFRLVLQ